MAVIPDVPHVVVDIVVDGTPLTEYLDEDDDEALSSDGITKYVECVSGSHFGIRNSFVGLQHQHLRGGDSVEVVYSLDGQKFGGVVFQYPWPAGSPAYTHHAARYVEGGTWKERPLMFANLVTTEDRAHSKPRPELNQLGTITVKLYHVRRGKIKYRASDTASRVNVGHENIHEKHLKGQAISTQAKLGEPRSIAPITSTSVTRIGSAFATFNFRYRSRKDLQISCLISRSPSPIPLEDRPEDSLTREELLELLRRQKADREEMIKIKQELKRERIEDDEGDDDLIVISSHPPTRKPKITADGSTGIEAVDLTDD